jgi:hypothetical protein
MCGAHSSDKLKEGLKNSFMLQRKKDSLLLFYGPFLGFLASFLSHNILQEISSYLQPPFPILPVIYSDSIAYFDFITEQIGPKTPLYHSIRKDSGTKWAVLDPDRIFVCGGGYYKVWNSAYFLHRSGEVQVLPHMIAGRSHCGIALWEDAVHVFGSSEHSQNMCERFPLHSSAWEWLPRMHRNRCLFTPAVWQAAIYLCQYVIEVYDGREMMELDIKLPQDNSSNFCCVLDDSLLAASRYHMTVYTKLPGEMGLLRSQIRSIIQ